MMRTLALAAALCLASSCFPGSEDDCEGEACACPAEGDCRRECLGECDLTCAGAQNCDFACTYDCAATCSGTGTCTAMVAAGSTVTCSGSGGCDVTCVEDCSVDCTGNDALCIARCYDDTVCELLCDGAPVSCPEGVLVCNGDCPEE